MSAIQEMRLDPNKKITLDALVGRLTTFELDNYDNYAPSSSNLEFAFKAKVSLKNKAKNSKRKKFKSEEEDSFDSDLESIEALLARRYPKGKEKYKGKIPLIYISCEEVGNIVARCPTRVVKDERSTTSKKARRISRTSRTTRTKVRYPFLWLKI